MNLHHEIKELIVEMVKNKYGNMIDFVDGLDAVRSIRIVFKNKHYPTIHMIIDKVIIAYTSAASYTSTSTLKRLNYEDFPNNVIEFIDSEIKIMQAHQQ